MITSRQIMIVSSRDAVLAQERGSLLGNPLVDAQCVNGGLGHLLHLILSVTVIFF